MPKGSGKPPKAPPDSTLVQKATARAKGAVAATRGAIKQAGEVVTRTNPFKKVSDDLKKLED